MAMMHDFSGDCWRDVRRNGQLPYADPDMLLNNAANAKLRKYREATRHPIDPWLSSQPSCLPRAVSTESFCAYFTSSPIARLSNSSKPLGP